MRMAHPRRLLQESKPTTPVTRLRKGEAAAIARAARWVRSGYDYLEIETLEKIKEEASDRRWRTIRVGTFVKVEVELREAHDATST